MYTHVEPLSGGWKQENIAQWLLPGSLPVQHDKTSEYAQGARWHDADDLVRCTVQGFPLTYEGRRKSRHRGRVPGDDRQI